MAKTSALIWRQIQPVRSVDIKLPVNVLESGVRFRPKRQMPILAGSALTVRDIVGSIRNLKIQAGTIRGDVRWCSDDAAQAVKSKVESGVLRFRLDIVELELSGNTIKRWMPTSATLEPQR